MSESWIVTPGTGSPLLDPLPRRDHYFIGDYDIWDRCPICDADHYSCFHIPGVTDAPPAENQ